ncbi:MAG: hypothetical protein ACI8WB_005642 [Phenylobacterium sp.]|jgi:hypothetical protein
MSAKAQSAVNAEDVKLTFDTLQTSEGFGTVTVVLPFELEQSVASQVGKTVLALYVGEQAPANRHLPGMAGRYAVVDGNLVFTPRFAPEPGLSYTAVFDAQGFNQLFGGYPPLPLLPQSVYQLSQYIAPEAELQQGEVTSIYPRLNILPQNVLRFYVYFSQPMSFDNPYDYLSIVNQDNAVVKTSFVEFRQGLWDQSRTRLTVFIHPGRIKRGVGPNLTQGPVFIQGQRYRLKVDQRFKTLDGMALSADFEKTFEIGAPVYEKLNLARWQLVLPPVNSQQRLVIKPERALDPLISVQMITLVNRNTGMPIDVNFTVDAAGVNLFVQPDSPWLAGEYQLKFESKLEDLSGNTPAWAFDSETPVNPSTHDYSMTFSL